MWVPWTVILTALSSIGPGRWCAVAFREIPMFEVHEVLRLWLAGRGLRSIAVMVRPDRKTSKPSSPNRQPGARPNFADAPDTDQQSTRSSSPSLNPAGP